MMEAAVAYYEATGKKDLLNTMTRMAEHIDSVLGPEESCTAIRATRASSWR